MANWSGLLNSSVGVVTLVSGKNPRRYSIKRTVNREGFRVLTALANGLIGAATGSNVTATHKRMGPGAVASDAGVGGGALGGTGGVRTPLTITDINRNTAAADVTALKELLFNVKTRPSYPKDLSGNGGRALT